MNKCDAVITVSQYEKDYLGKKGIPHEKLYVTGNAIHPEQYTPVNLENYKVALMSKYNISEKDKIVIFIGRKTKEKGVSNLIEAVSGLCHTMPLKLFLLGPSIDWYENYYAQLSTKVKEYIIDLGVVSHQDKINLLHLSDLLVLPSQYEAFGIVFLEAWICGVPVMGTTEGAMPSIIGEDGFLCKFGDTEYLMTKLSMALNSPDALKQKGSSGKRKVLQRYTWDIIGMKAEEAIKAAYDN